MEDSKEVEMAVEGSEEAGKDKSEEGGDEKSKLQAQKDKDLLTFEGIWIELRYCDVGSRDRRYPGADEADRARGAPEGGEVYQQSSEVYPESEEEDERCYLETSHHGLLPFQ